MAAGVELREVSNEEGNRLLGLVRRGSGSIVTWRRAQIVLLAAQGMPSLRIAEVVFSDPDTVREVTFCTTIRARYPAQARLAFVLDNFSVHKGDDVRAWAAANNVEFAYTPHYASWLNRIEPQFKGLRYFCLDGTDHPDHHIQARLITDYIDWRNAHRDDPKLRHLTRRTLAPKAAPFKPANVA